MNEQEAVQLKIVQLIILAKELAMRPDTLSPSEALAYKQALDFIRAHARLMELYTLQTMRQAEAEFYGEEQPKPERPESFGVEPTGRVAEQPDGQTNPGAGESAEGGGLVDGSDCDPCGPTA